jgi:3-oxoacyl-[acyl-carrier protein] reductase
MPGASIDFRGALMAERVALVTGGAKGIGREIGLRLGERGWAVALCYRTSEEEAQRTTADIEKRGGAALGVRADVSRPETCAELVRTVTEWRGRVDALVHCAGPYHRVDVLSETPEGWREMFAHNLDSLFFLARLVAPGMKERAWGRIIGFSIANADRLVAQPQLTAHYLAKVGVLGLVRSLSKALAKHGVTVNAVAPGFVNSGSMDADELKKLAGQIPAGYVGETADAAHAALWLLSDEARYVTGSQIHVSGGWGL